MKKSLSFIAILFLASNAFAQTFTNNVKIKERKDDLILTLSENEKNKIDWNFFEDYFSDRNKKDSIQFSIKLIQPKTNNLNSEKKYTVRGIAENFDELLETMKKLVK